MLNFARFQSGIRKKFCRYCHFKLTICLISKNDQSAYKSFGNRTESVALEDRKLKWGGGGPMAKNGEKWRKMAMANSAFSFVKFANFSPIFDFGISHLTDF